MPTRAKFEKVGTDKYYVVVDGQRWSPVCRANDASRFFDRAMKIYELAKGVHTIQLVHIMDEHMVGLR